MVHKTTLDNGVRIVTERLGESHSVALGLWVQAGSRDEAPPQGGVSHMIEHMAFKGTDRRNAVEIAREIDRMGGMANAFTSKEFTCFHARTLVEQMPLLCDMLLDILLHPRIDPEELERERQVIMQEISSVDETPDELVHVLFNRNYWPEHPLGAPILGTAQSVAKLNREAIISHLKSSYTAGGLVVSAVGAMDHSQILDLIAGPLSQLPALNSSDGRYPPKANPELHIRSHNTEQVHVILGAQAPSAVHKDRYAASLMNLMLGGGMSSRLFQEVREKRGLAYSVYSFINSYCDSGLLGIYMGIQPSRLQEGMEVVRQELLRIATQPVGRDELDDALMSLKGSILLSSESSETRMGRLARNEYNFGRSLSLEEILDNLYAVTVDDISRVAREILNLDNLGGTILGPVDENSISQGDLM
jgi:predicted Zn-dependent peptidase